MQPKEAMSHLVILLLLIVAIPFIKAELDIQAALPGASRMVLFADFAIPLFMIVSAIAYGGMITYSAMRRG